MASSSRISCEPNAPVQQRAVGGDGVLDGGGERVLGGEAVVDGYGRCPCAPGDVRGQADRVGSRSQGVRAAELRRTEPAQVTVLHNVAAHWYAANGYPIDAIRHAQAADDWDLAVRVLSDHWVDLCLGGRLGAVQELFAAFPASIVAADAELAVLMAAGDLEYGSLRKAERRLALATAESGAVPADRRGHFEVMCTVVRLRLARRQGDLPAVTREAQRLLTAVQTADAQSGAAGEPPNTVL